MAKAAISERLFVHQPVRVPSLGPGNYQLRWPARSDRARGRTGCHFQLTGLHSLLGQEVPVEG